MAQVNLPMASSTNNTTEEQDDIFKQKFTLTDIFTQIIEGKPLEIDIHNVKLIMKCSLKIEVDTLKRKLQCFLPYMFVHFIRSWPGWQKSNKYFEKQISFENWFEKFKEYLIFKVTFFIKNFEKNNLLDDDYHRVTTEAQTTTPAGGKEVAPFILEIRGPPKLLNSLVFSEGVKGDVLLKEYKINSLWPETLQIRQLVNWPCIELEFKTSELYFKRNNEHEFKRFLTFSTEKVIFSKPESMIEEIEMIDEKIERKAYTLNAIKEYCNLYITLLKEYQTFLCVSNRYLEQIETILEDFILDIVDINLKSMATNTSVLFNIGNSVYARNKTIKTSDEALCLMDSITPRMRLSLIDFSAIINPENVDEPFPKLQKLFGNANNQSIKEIIPTIAFNCTYCKENFKTNVDVWVHLRSRHNMEQPVLCFRCKQQMKVTDLTGNRWRHNCNYRLNNSTERK